MESFENKREALLAMAEFYLDTRPKSYIDVNDKVLNTGDFDSRNFLMLMALTLPNDGTNFYALDLEVDIETQRDFVDREFKKVKTLAIDVVQKGKIVLDDAQKYYISKFDDISFEELNRIAQKLSEEGIHI